MLSRTSPSRGPGSAEVTGFHDNDTGSIQYVVTDPETKICAVVDVVLDFDPVSARMSTRNAEAILEFLRERDLAVEWILETHPHADHLMAAAWLKEKLGPPIAIGEKVAEVTDLCRELYHFPDASDPVLDFDRLLADGDAFTIGTLPVKVMLTPGHTPASISYLVGSDAAFVADTLMHTDFGTARADFPGGSARELYRSLEKILALPDDTRLFVGHDYGTEERQAPAWEASVAEHRAENVHVGGGIGEDDFVRLREDRDATLPLPARMLYALQFNLRGGRLPAEDDGHAYFRIAANRF